MKEKTKIRLFISEPLVLGSEIELDTGQAHYLGNVLRLNCGDVIRAFDGCHGEFDCKISLLQKKQGRILVEKCCREFIAVPDIWLMFAPVKKENTDFIIEKATELGASALLPVITRRTISGNVKAERFKAQAVEASEQCRRLDVPRVDEAVSLDNLLKKWDAGRVLYFMDETGNGNSALEVFSQAEKGRPAAILVGPEGGFDPAELEQLRHLPFAMPVSLGPRILRAETAVAAALSVWQMLCGDWKEKGDN